MTSKRRLRILHSEEYFFEIDCQIKGMDREWLASGRN